MSKRLWKAALLKTFPVFASYLFLGIGYGILMQKAGFGFLLTALSCILIYSGTMQYVSVPLMVSGGVGTAALTTLLVNCRHIFYSISMAPQYKNAGFFRKFYLLFATTDEIYALVSDGHYVEGEDPYKYWFLCTALNQSYWLFGSCLGVLLGQVMPFDSTGIDFIMTAMFVTIFVDQWKASSSKVPSITGFGVTALSLMIFGSDNFLIPAMVGITVILFAFRKKIEAKMPELLEDRSPEAQQARAEAADGVATDSVSTDDAAADVAVAEGAVADDTAADSAPESEVAD